MSNTPELLFDTKSVVGEGPIWDFESHVLYWLDIFGKKLHFHDPSTGSHEVRELQELVGTVVCRQSGGLVLALKSGFAFYDVDSEVVTPIVDPESHIPTNHFNDGKCDPAGRLWAGTMPDSEDSPAGGMYRLDADLSVHLQWYLLEPRRQDDVLHRHAFDEDRGVRLRQRNGRR